MRAFDNGRAHSNCGPNGCFEGCRARNARGTLDTSTTAAPEGDITSRPTRAELKAATGKNVPDVIAPGLVVLFVGINPGLYSAAVGHHFARPGNRFWPALHDAGFTPRLFEPCDEAELPALGLGITNLVPRATAGAAELSADELRRGKGRLEEKVARYSPVWTAFVGMGAYATAFRRPKAALGPQEERLGEARIWLLPNTSGLNAHYTPTRFAELFGELRAAVASLLPAR